ncbi:hypothetical protein CCACVL1_21746 [Corchorus capsularis]|uniref:Uncharacterized protein n=1 Tax=Corchorus capsularis TaxID=210143 RepID=A0A1R3H2A1_COCAP|nr:hypothetical protein CCACVL1_21746 [Corchorus capsularis]
MGFDLFKTISETCGGATHENIEKPKPSPS